MKKIINFSYRVSVLLAPCIWHAANYISKLSCKREIVLLMIVTVESILICLAVFEVEEKKGCHIFTELLTILVLISSCSHYLL